MLKYLAKYRSQHDVTAEKQQNMCISIATYVLPCFSVLRAVRESKHSFIQSGVYYSIGARETE